MKEIQGSVGFVVKKASIPFNFIESKSSFKSHSITLESPLTSVSIPYLLVGFLPPPGRDSMPRGPGTAATRPAPLVRPGRPATAAQATGTAALRGTRGRGWGSKSAKSLKVYEFGWFLRNFEGFSNGFGWFFNIFGVFLWNDVNCSNEGLWKKNTWIQNCPTIARPVPCPAGAQRCVVHHLAAPRRCRMRNPALRAQGAGAEDFGLGRLEDEGPLWIFGNPLLKEW